VRARLWCEVPAPQVYLIGVDGWLDAVAGVRLVRLLDGRLSINAPGTPPVQRVVIDLRGLDGMDGAGARALERARRTAEHHGAAVQLVADHALRGHEPIGDRPQLAWLARFPTVDEALRADPATPQLLTHMTRPEETVYSRTTRLTRFRSRRARANSR